MMVGWDMTLAGWAWMFIWIAALLAMVWLLVRHDGQPSPKDPLEILRERFARGEISQEEFERARVALLADQREFTR
ncbi:MAG TPA: SHOCT domain-containing protein [Candidatus Limnocylindrales bacterium]|jgi:putative membrane protein|nr:SHOCT domain-containing protein [Candidatus Limnocylindrales bacterium]